MMRQGVPSLRVSHRSPDTVKAKLVPVMLPARMFTTTSRAVLVSKLQAFRDTSYLGLENISLVTGTGHLHLRVRRPKFYCLNDNFGEHPNPRCVRLVERFLQASYPEPSRFEKRGATSQVPWRGSGSSRRQPPGPAPCAAASSLTSAPT